MVNGGNGGNEGMSDHVRMMDGKALRIMHTLPAKSKIKIKNKNESKIQC
jgi:hypothetical protein